MATAYAASTGFKWRGFTSAIGQWIESLNIPVGEGVAADTYVLGKNFTIVEMSLDVQGVDSLVANHTLLTLFNEASTMDLANGRRIQQTRIVRLLRRGGTARTALSELERIFEVIVDRRGRFTSPGFLGFLRRPVQTPYVLIRNSDDSVHASCILEFIAYSR